VAELIDNAVDARATRFYIDTNSVKDRLEEVRYLSFQDNGTGMKPRDLHKMCSFGHCDKVKTDDLTPIGHYGNGFKSGSMRLGKDVLVFTKTTSARSIALLSQTFLAAIEADEVLVPMVTWNNSGKIIADDDLNLTVDDMKRSLELIKKHSIFRTEAALAEQFDSLTSRTGTRIVVFRLKRLEMRNLLELSFLDKHDIQLTQDTPKEKGGEYIHPALYSLREYCKVLYLEPKLMIFLRGKKVRSLRMVQELYHPKYAGYKPQKLVDDDGVKVEARIVYGFNKRSKREYGMMLYQKNRLIRFFVPVGMQKQAGSRGRGVLIITDAYFLAPTHNKQEFMRDDRYRGLEDAIKTNLNHYWNSCNIDAHQGNAGIGDFMHKLYDRETKGPYWIQCDNCGKWRRVSTDPEQLKEDWTCAMNADHRHNSCSIPQQPDDIIPPIPSKFKRKERKAKVQVEEEELESNMNIEDNDELIGDISESDDDSEPGKSTKASRLPPKPGPKKASGTPRQAAKRKRSEDESQSDEAVEPVKVKRSRRAEVSPEPSHLTNSYSENGTASTNKTPVTPASKSNGSSSRALTQSSSDKDLQILVSKLQVICARLGGKPYQNLTLGKLKTLDELKFCTMIEEKFQSASMSIEDRLARVTTSPPPPEESEQEEEHRADDAAMNVDENHVSESHVSESSSHENHVTNDAQPVYFNFL
jgi:hypothetical protein